MVSVKIKIKTMEKITKQFSFRLKEHLCVETTEECGEKMTPTMRVIKKCTDFIDGFCHNPDDEYEIKYASHTAEPNGKSETFAVNFSYIDEEGNTFASYSYFVAYNYDTKVIKLDYTMQHKKNVNSSVVIEKLSEILEKITE